MQNNQFHIRINIQANQLKIIFKNNSTRETNLWSLSDYLGWETLSFQLKNITFENTKTIKRKSRDWTGSEETLLKIPPGSSRDFKINLKDGWWDIDESADELIKEPIMIRAVLNSPSSKEAEDNKVFIGEIQSDWILSNQPHPWLFSDHQLQLELNIVSNQLKVTVSNVSPNEIRLWDFNNNWGWETLSLRLKIEEKEVRIERVMRYLKESPKINKLPPGENFVIDINLQDEKWQLTGLPQNLNNIPVQIQAILTVPVYPETEEYQAFYGWLKSNWIVSVPPHKWLFNNQ